MLVAPAYFSVQVVKTSDSPAETSGYWTFSEFGLTKHMKLYSIFVLLLESLIPLISLIVMNSIAQLKFSEIMKKKRAIISNDLRAKKASHRFTRLIITLTLISIITRAFDTSLAIFFRARLLTGMAVSIELNALVKLLRAAAFFLQFAGHALDGLLYFFFDSQLRSLFRNPFRS